jgi:hypothetical protein
MPGRCKVGEGIHPIDGYLLDGKPDKAAAIAAVLAERRPVERAQPFYRALDVLGARVADEALMALRLALAGHVPDDAAVTSLRALVAAARRGDPKARRAYFLAVETA